MKHAHHPLIVLLALVLGMGSAAAIGSGHSTSGRVYTVAAARASPQRQPAAWLGRAVRLRGSLPCAGLACPAPVVEKGSIAPTR